MTSDGGDEPSAAVSADASFRQAVKHHQAGRLTEAARLYRRTLEIDPTHAVANHNLGALAVQAGTPSDGLPYFLAALEADPTQGGYWSSYIDALIRAGQREDARQVLELACQQGLQGDEVDALTARLDSPPPLSGVDAGRADKARQTTVRKHAREPKSSEINALIGLFNQERLAEAATMARTLTERYPGHWVGWKMLGVVFQQMGRCADALQPMQRAVQLSPRDAEAHNNLGIILKELGRLPESERSYRRALELEAGYAQAHSNLGATLQHLGRMAEAEACYRQALLIDPNYAKAHCNLGALLHDLDRLEEAEASYRHALNLNPDDAEAHRNLGITLKDLGRLDEASASVRRALEIRPNHPDALGSLGVILFKSGRATEAEASLRRALELEPGDFKSHSDLAAVLIDLGRTDEAEISARRALEINPDLVEALTNLGVSLRDQGRLDEAEAAYRQALAITPNSADTLGNLGGVLHDLGRIDESMASYRRALAIDPDSTRTHSNLLFCMSQMVTIGPRELFAEHCQFGVKLESNLRSSWPTFSNRRDPERPLRIGFVSGDFRNHAIAYFIEPILTALARFPGLSLHAYSNHVIEDDVTQRLRANFEQWNSIGGLSDKAVATQIFSDDIDILIDLSGHTAKNRLAALARKPAPVQASWMGYPGTTGLTAVDYYLADGRYLPPGQFDDQYCEKIVRLPASAPFVPSGEAPPISPLPALQSGHLTFGSFNRVGKISHSVVSVWSQLLRALPESKMILGAMREGERYESLTEWFEREGISRQRLDFLPRSDMKTYLGQHYQVDICLDTFPYNGGTTTLHALWMGVPTLTLVGNTTAGRTGASILGHVGLDEFVASSIEDFIQKGVSWAANLATLSEIRTDLRQRIGKSVISQPRLIAAGLEQALRTMWRHWCAELPPRSFEVTREIAETSLKAHK